MFVILGRKVVVKRLYLRVIALGCLVAGVAIAPFTPTGEKPIESRFLVILEPPPETIFQNRNRSDYDIGEPAVTCPGVERSGVCGGIQEVQKFISEHLRQERRGYVTVTNVGVDSISKDHVFIEPDEFGIWKVQVRRESTNTNLGPSMHAFYTDLRY